MDTGEYLVVMDCGVGCHYRLSDRGLSTEVDYVFITHGHMDHFLGLPEALFQAYVEGRKKPLRIFAPPPVEEVAKILASHFVAEVAAAPYEISLHRVSPASSWICRGLGWRPPRSATTRPRRRTASG